MTAIPLTRPVATARDLLALTKPGITTMVVLTTGIGLWLAPAPVSAGRAALALSLTAAMVGAANALNCWLERDSDALMARTRDRPLPSGRLDPTLALAFGVGLAMVSAVGLTVGIGGLAALLAALALTIYVLIYTPMKRRSPDALLVGAIPGALPPLVGWAAATGDLAPPAWCLAAIVFLWQLPHFVAIALLARDQYARAGMRVLPVVLGDRATRRRGAGWAAALIPVSLLLAPTGAAGAAYTIGAAVLGAAYLGVALAGLRRGAARPSARALFLASLAYLPLWALLLALDGVAG